MSRLVRRAELALLLLSSVAACALGAENHSDPEQTAIQVSSVAAGTVTGVGGFMTFGGNDNLCLDVGATPVAGTQPVSATCNGGPGQTFQVTRSGAISPKSVASLLCLAAPPGAPLQLAPCATTSAQQFQVGATIAGGTGCFDVQTGSSATGTPVVIAPCASVSEQLFLPFNFTVAYQSVNGSPSGSGSSGSSDGGGAGASCLTEVTESSGVEVFDVAPCVSGSGSSSGGSSGGSGGTPAAQRFIPNSQGQIVQSGSCMWQNHGQLELTLCLNGFPSEKWMFTPAIGGPTSAVSIVQNVSGLCITSEGAGPALARPCGASSAQWWQVVSLQ